MVNIHFELEKLRINLINKGLNSSTVDKIVAKAQAEIHEKLKPTLESAMASAIEAGVEKRSADFINALVIDEQMLSIRTDSGNTDFSDPPFPMLPALLKNAKPMKDGSGVYKVIPVGTPGNKPSIASNIFDAQKQINTERLENAKKTYSKVAPKGSKTNFRTATSKQSQVTQWVKPAQEKNFQEDLQGINTEIQASAEDVIRDTLREYEEGY